LYDTTGRPKKVGPDKPIGQMTEDWQNGPLTSAAKDIKPEDYVKASETAYRQIGDPARMKNPRPGVAYEKWPREFRVGDVVSYKHRVTGREIFGRIIEVDKTKRHPPTVMTTEGHSVVIGSLTLWKKKDERGLQGDAFRAKRAGGLGKAQGDHRVASFKNNARRIR